MVDGGLQRQRRRTAELPDYPHPPSCYAKGFAGRSPFPYGEGVLGLIPQNQAAKPPRRLTLQWAQSLSMAATRLSNISSVWNGVGVKRRRSVPLGTVG